jgi:putative transposase
MECPYCQSATTNERPETTTQGYRRFRCRACARGFNERTGSILNRVQYPPDVVCLVVLWRIRYKLSLRDLSEMFLDRGVIFTHEAVREWGAANACVYCTPSRFAKVSNGPLQGWALWPIRCF